MKRVERFLFETCAFTCAVMLAFFLFALAFVDGARLSFFNYFICFVIGAVITASNLIFKLDKLKVWVRVPLHFVVLLGMFILFMYVSAPEAMERDSALFVAIIVFIVLYAVFFALAIGIRRLVSGADKRIAARDKGAKAPTGGSGEYKPRYK